ncbi:hypothetical protein JTB14_010203 [Gonioctena quinquepunctata]|nr:hypothetical protein JTB14_010203 [Gonioctena quinquepunctata]
MDDIEKEAKSLMQRFIGHVKKTSTPQQIIIGASSGWVSGYLVMRVAKTAALALGGGIILLEVANQKGYIKINWDKFGKKADKVEEEVTDQASKWIDKTEKLIDNKLSEAKNCLKKNKKTKNWFSAIMGDDCQLRDYHVFMVSFMAGIALGIGTS